VKGKEKKKGNSNYIKELKKIMKCNICKEFNHWARECPNKKQKMELKDNSEGNLMMMT
jgi:hypothetical protein